jgi:CDGSH-type Zn-finger protein/ferredoxin
MSSEKPTIAANPNGPYLAKGFDVLRNAKGPLESKPTMALCRCGASNNKPFCDGAHAAIGFSSEKLEGRTPDKRDNHKGADITVHDNRGMCAHAGACTNSLPNVFRVRQEPFVDPNGASAQEIIETIEKCPSGALRYSVDGKEAGDIDADPSIFVVPNGPYAVTGAPDLQGIECGEGVTNDHITLCRCGGSKNKPFCDGTHWSNGFKDE